MVIDVIDLVKVRDEVLVVIRVKSEFLVIMSYEIRILINVVIGMIGLLLDIFLKLD